MKMPFLQRRVSRARTEKGEIEARAHAVLVQPPFILKYLWVPLLCGYQLRLSFSFNNLTQCLRQAFKSPSPLAPAEIA